MIRLLPRRASLNAAARAIPELYSLSFSVYADESGKEIWDLCIASHPRRGRRGARLSKALIYASAVADLDA
jgi:hypothetical protein